MKAKDTKPMLVDFDEIEYRRDVRKLQQLVDECGEKLEKAFERTALGQLTDDYLKCILNKNLSVIRKDVEKIISSVLDPEYLQTEIQQNVNRRMAELEKETAEFHSWVDLRALHNLLEYISINENGKIEISEESKKRLKESHCYYVVTEEGKRRRELHLAAVKAINAFADAMGDQLGFSHVLNTFGTDDNDRVIPVVYYYE